MKNNFVRTKSLIKYVILLGLIHFSTLEAAGNSASITIEEYAKNRFGNVLFLRHAFAPGYDANGEPTKFDIDICATQRNLDSTGRKQATDIGKQIADNGIEFSAIYSSQWCRCLETARLLNLGSVVPEPALNSGFKGKFDKEKSLVVLKTILDTMSNEAKPILMVTHQGIIFAITGNSVHSGGAVAYDTMTKESRVITFQ